MAGDSSPSWTPPVPTTPKSAAGTAVAAVVGYEVAATVVNEFLDIDVMPSLLSRLLALTPLGVARAATPPWTRYAAWIGVGAVFTVVAAAARSALPARLRR